MPGILTDAEVARRLVLSKADKILALIASRDLTLADIGKKGNRRPTWPRPCRLADCSDCRSGPAEAAEYTVWYEVFPGVTDSRDGPMAESFGTCVDLCERVSG
jgi:hypothetical protein